MGKFPYYLIAIMSLAISLPLLAKADPFIVGITGGSASGKTTLATQLIQLLSRYDSQICLLSQDRYFDHSQQPEKFRMKFPPEFAGLPNFDHPTSLNLELMVKQLEQLKNGEAVRVPVEPWNVERLQRNTDMIGPCRIVVVEGIHAFYLDQLRDLYQFKIFVRAPEHLRLERRKKRDLAERGSSIEETEKVFKYMVKPIHDEWIEPMERYADQSIAGEMVRDPSTIDGILKQIVPLFHKKEYPWSVVSAPPAIRI